MRRRPKPRAKPGPKPDVLKLSGNWIDNITTAIKKTKPKRGWPKPKR